MSPSQDLNKIQYPEMIGDMFIQIKWFMERYEQTDENIKDYRDGLYIYFKELKLIKSFNKEFEGEQIKYDLYNHGNVRQWLRKLYSKLKI